MYKKTGIVLVLSLLVFCSCAKRGSISGGLKDTLAPVLKFCIPKNYTTNFSTKTVQFTFDEYVKLKNVNKQLIISPPLKYQPEITPSTASKTIILKIKDTLAPNTTYSFNFGESIQDNNEGNPLRQFKFLCSTGSYIDSLSIKGTIADALNTKTDHFVSVMLYEANEKYTDSIVFKENPRYVTNTLDSATTFELANLKAGKYLLVALKDENSNYRFNPKEDKIGFHQQFITVPTDSVFNLKLFKEVPANKTVKVSQASANRLLLGYEGEPSKIKVNLTKAGENYPVLISKFPKKDSIQIWHKPIKWSMKTKEEKAKIDSISVDVTNGIAMQNFMVKLKGQKVDSLSIKPVFSGVLPLKNEFELETSTPIVKWDASKMSIKRKDSTQVTFRVVNDTWNQKLTLAFAKEPLEKYTIQLLPGALTDFMEQTNDTVVYKVETKNTSEYGNLQLTISNAKRFPLLVELLDKSGEVLEQAVLASPEPLPFSLIKPEKYTLRVIYDDNQNKAWDAGNFLAKRQSEEVFYFPKEIDVRANWDIEQMVNLQP
ncbi:MAG: hypothetical protein FGM16_01535 [Flavobacterium sp.]|nr:hypothetical protein [Flavobacterium sp.]